MEDPKKIAQEALINTLNHNTHVIKQSESVLKLMEESNQYPFILASIILENPKSQNQLDFLAVLALERYMKVNYKFVFCHLMSNNQALGALKE